MIYGAPMINRHAPQQ